MNRHITRLSSTAVKCWLFAAKAGLSSVERRSNPCAYWGVGRVSWWLPPRVAVAYPIDMPFRARAEWAGSSSPFTA